MRVGINLSPDQVIEYKCSDNFGSMMLAAKFLRDSKTIFGSKYIVSSGLYVFGSTISEISKNLQTLKTSSIYVFCIDKGIDTKKQDIQALFGLSAQIDDELRALKLRSVENELLELKFRKRKRKLTLSKYESLRFEHNKSHSEIARIANVTTRTVEYVAKEYRESIRNKIVLSGK